MIAESTLVKYLAACGLYVLLAGAAPAPVVSADTWLVARADVFDATVSDELLLLPDGKVFHVAQMRLRSLYQTYSGSDTLVYHVGDDRLTVHRQATPSDLLLREPLQSVSAEPAIFAGVDVTRSVAIFDAASRFFFASTPGYPYTDPDLDGSARFLFVGLIEQPYRDYQPALNPFQQDGDGDGVPDSSDNCSAWPNGPGNTTLSGPAQYDVDGDGFGNRCDADLTNDCVVNALDLGVLKSEFFASGANVADLNGDGVVNAIDLGLLRTLFFLPPGPSGIASCNP